MLPFDMCDFGAFLMVDVGYSRGVFQLDSCQVTLQLRGLALKGQPQLPSSRMLIGHTNPKRSFRTPPQPNRLTDASDVLRTFYISWEKGLPDSSNGLEMHHTRESLALNGVLQGPSQFVPHYQNYVL